jgi:hypothetical protein
MGSGSVLRGWSLINLEPRGTFHRRAFLSGTLDGLRVTASFLAFQPCFDTLKQFLGRGAKLLHQRFDVLRDEPRDRLAYPHAFLILDHVGTCATSASSKCKAGTGRYVPSFVGSCVSRWRPPGSLSTRAAAGTSPAASAPDTSLPSLIFPNLASNPEHAAGFGGDARRPR